MKCYNIKGIYRIFPWVISLSCKFKNCLMNGKNDFQIDIHFFGNYHKSSILEQVTYHSMYHSIYSRKQTAILSDNLLSNPDQ